MLRFQHTESKRIKIIKRHPGTDIFVTNVLQFSFLRNESLFRTYIAHIEQKMGIFSSRILYCRTRCWYSGPINPPR